MPHPASRRVKRKRPVCVCAVRDDSLSDESGHDKCPSVPLNRRRTRRTPAAGGTLVELELLGAHRSVGCSGACLPGAWPRTRRANRMPMFVAPVRSRFCRRPHSSCLQTRSPLISLVGLAVALIAEYAVPAPTPTDGRPLVFSPISYCLYSCKLHGQGRGFFLTRSARNVADPPRRVV